MIYIVKNTASNVVLTLNENKTLSNPDWLFEFKNDITNDTKIFHGTDISLTPGRYNQFTITDSITENPNNAQMNFLPLGYWTYTIYEMNNTSPIDLDPDNAVSIVETGKVLVDDIYAGTASSFIKGDNDNYGVYTKGD